MVKSIIKTKWLGDTVAELIGTTKDGDPTPEISITPVVAEKDDDVKEAEEEQGDNDSTDDSSEGVKKYTTPKNVWIQKQMLRVMGSKAHLRAGEVLPKDMDEDQQGIWKYFISLATMSKM